MVRSLLNISLCVPILSLEYSQFSCSIACIENDLVAGVVHAKVRSSALRIHGMSVVVCGWSSHFSIGEVHCSMLAAAGLLFIDDLAA